MAEMNHNVRCAADQRRNGQQRQHSINKLNPIIIGTIVTAILSPTSLTKTKSALSNRNTSASVHYPTFLFISFFFCIGSSVLKLFSFNCLFIFCFSFDYFLYCCKRAPFFLLSFCLEPVALVFETDKACNLGDCRFDCCDGQSVCLFVGRFLDPAAPRK